MQAKIKIRLQLLKQLTAQGVLRCGWASLMIDAYPDVGEAKVYGNG